MMQHHHVLYHHDKVQKDLSTLSLNFHTPLDTEANITVKEKFQ